MGFVVEGLERGAAADQGADLLGDAEVGRRPADPFLHHVLLVADERDLLLVQPEREEEPVLGRVDVGVPVGVEADHRGEGVVERRRVAPLVEEELVGHADGPQLGEGTQGAARGAVGQGAALVGGVRRLLLERLVALARPADERVRDPFGVLLLEPQGVEQLDQGVLVEVGQRQLAALVLELERHLEALARREARVGVRIVEALRRVVDLVQVDRADLGDDRQGELELRLRVGPEAASVGVARGHGQLERVVLHEASEQQRGQRDEHQDHDDDGAAAAGGAAHGREAPGRRMGRSRITTCLRVPRSKRRWSRAGFRHAVPAGSRTGSSSTFQVLRSAS